MCLNANEMLKKFKNIIKTVLGTIGLEICEQVAYPDAVVIPVGGGGLIAGVATAIKALSPNTKIIVNKL